MERKTLVIIDGYSLLYRAFFATRYLSTSDGRPTNALYGFASMLFLLLEKIRPDAIVVALDAPGKTFRHAEYAEYKGTRRETADELKTQLPIARELISNLGIPQVEVVGFEADDVVGTISLQAESEGYDTFIVTGDLDSLQLVDNDVSVITMRQGVTDTVTYDPKAVVERYGFGPEYIPDYKAIVGDTSDNIPGIPGIGQKGATELITKYGTIEKILAQLDQIEPKFQKKIQGNEEQAVKSKWLATIVRTVPLEFEFKPFVLTPAELQAAKNWLESLEFRSAVRRADAVLGPYLEGGNRSAEIVEVKTEALQVQFGGVVNAEQLAVWIGDQPFALVPGPAPVANDLFDDRESACFVAIGTDVREAPLSAGLALVQKCPQQAALHDCKGLYHQMPPLSEGPGFDASLAGFVLQPGRSMYALRDLVQGYLEVSAPEDHTQLAAGLALLRPVLEERLEKEGETAVLKEIEQPLIPILANMERIGIRASGKQLTDYSKELEGMIATRAASIYEQAGTEFTIGSPKQLGEILFEKMMLPGSKKTKTGYATGVEILQTLEESYPIVKDVLTWRELSKLKSTYTDALEKMIKHDGRIHTTYNQTGAATGRLSSNDPNLQNIPIRTELGRGIRKAFIAGEGYRLLSIDYSQIELRILAHMCEDEPLVRAFSDRVDVHTVTAQQTFGLGDAEPTKEQRRLAKMLNYAALYGVTDFGLAQQLGAGFSIVEAKELLKKYFERFPRIYSFTQEVVVEARSKGFTTTLCGRRRHFPDIHSAKIMERKAAERQAVNAPLQGTAADMLKLAMIKVQPLLHGKRSRMLLNVHDELVFELADGEDELIKPICEAMEAALPLKVPVEVDAKVGQNWNDMEKIAR